MVMKAPVSGLNLASPPSYCPPLKRVLVNCPTWRTPFFNGGVYMSYNFEKREKKGEGIGPSLSSGSVPPAICRTGELRLCRKEGEALSKACGVEELAGMLILDFRMRDKLMVYFSVRSLEGMGIQTSNSISRISAKGGGSLGARMNLFDRLARVVKSYVNVFLTSMEDPEKILDQAVLEMNDDLIKMRQATAQVLASQKRLENKYKAAEQASNDWYRRAQLALEKGDENLAREALKRRKSYAVVEPSKSRDNASSLKAQLVQQKAVVDNLVSNTRLLESKIQEAKAKKDTLKARAQSARTATKVSEMLGNVNTSSALSAFEKMEEKVLAMESQAESLSQLTSDDLEGKFALLENSSVDDDLAKLKQQLSGTSMKGELPAGRSAVSSSAFPFRDVEIENELNELRRKAKEY
ncbi:putative membrane-associated 30 kDa protein, chloroplastic [Apostasia shenzhenica]|uniref:Putative membrane-associated 30 kDa protein, chloroplastic n=1 Tax=Apostasia shenzhenica TaxID=1088818 RepID=A0A2I0B184_9ASPA|nr:putative membrane-associated 30 kDa protein, chloroplastic [Apostasia shenzhenica]